MNKQEVIEKIEKLEGLTIKDKDFNLDIEMIPKGDVLEIIEQIDELEKPVVPQYIDTWIQGCKYSGFDLLEAMTMSIDIPEKTSRWISDNPETFAKAWLYDYDVEKEKLYTVEIPSNNETHHFVLRKYVDGEVCIDYYLSFDWRDYKCVQLTEAEIKKDFDWAWKFAEEVEVLDEK